MFAVLLSFVRNHVLEKHLERERECAKYVLCENSLIAFNIKFIP